MATQEPPLAVPDPQDAWRSDPRWKLVERVANGTALRRSWRLRALLLFLGERAIRSAGPIHETEIGAAVFGRGADFSATDDTLVRVQISQLRKRLQRHFSGEGAAEPLLIDLPKGSYRPVFTDRHQQRDVDGGALEADVAPPAVLVQPSRGRLAVAAGLAVLALVVSCIYLLLEVQALRRRTAASPSRPTVERLWRQMFGDGRSMIVVLSDANLTVLHDALRRQLSPLEYQRIREPYMREEMLRADPVLGRFIHTLQGRQFTTIADAKVARQVGVLNAPLGVSMSIVLARDAVPGDFKVQHLVLAGPRRANPWLDLFEDRLNFRSGFDETSHRSYFDNAAPLPGEQARYWVDWTHVGYCRVAYVPNHGGSGTALLLSGTETMSTEACVDFIGDERHVKDLQGTLRIAPGNRFPHFEVLLRTTLVVGGAPSFEPIAHRTLAP